MNFVFLGLSITSSWGNGHATTYRGLVRELALRGHDILFLERDVPWYADNRDAPRFPFAEVGLYRSFAELKRLYAARIREADAVIVGSYVPEGATIGDWVTRQAQGVTAFYDIDTPVTLAKLKTGSIDYLTPELIPRYDFYFSFTGGPTLRRLEEELGSPCARPLYCSVDPTHYYPERIEGQWKLGYLGTYSADRQPTLDRLLVRAAEMMPQEQFVVAGPQYPDTLVWPDNVQRIAHLAPAKHRHFYNQQFFTLNVTRADMIAAGYSPSVRLFEAAACGTPIISDAWAGLEDFFTPGSEILIAQSTEEVVSLLRDTPPERAAAIGAAARRRVLHEHTAAHRAVELECHLRPSVRNHQALRESPKRERGAPLALRPRGRSFA